MDEHELRQRWLNTRTAVRLLYWELRRNGVTAYGLCDHPGYSEAMRVQAEAYAAFHAVRVRREQQCRTK